MSGNERKMERQLNVLDKWKIESNTSEYNLLRLKQEVDNAKRGHGGINLKPYYQREYKFNITQESALIESLIGGIPIHSVYMASDTTQIPHVLNVIDGQHRIMSIVRFLNDEYKLRGLEELKELNGLRFSQLHPRLQSILLYNTSLKCEIIHIKDNPDLELEVFKRYNKGTNPLTPQEIRHVVFASSFNDWLCKKIDEYNSDVYMKYLFDITNAKYKSKSIHTFLYVICSMYSHMTDEKYCAYNEKLKETSKSPVFRVDRFTGVNFSFKGTANYATNFMAYVRQLEDEEVEEKIKDIEKFIEDFAEFLYMVYRRENEVHPISREILEEDIEPLGRVVKAQPTMVMILVPLFIHIKRIGVNYRDLEESKILRKLIRESFEGTSFYEAHRNRKTYNNISDIHVDTHTIIKKVIEHYKKDKQV